MLLVLILLELIVNLVSVNLGVLVSTFVEDVEVLDLVDILTSSLCRVEYIFTDHREHYNVAETD